MTKGRKGYFSGTFSASKSKTFRNNKLIFQNFWALTRYDHHQRSDKLFRNPFHIRIQMQRCKTQRARYHTKLRAQDHLLGLSLSLNYKLKTLKSFCYNIYYKFCWVLLSSTHPSVQHTKASFQHKCVISPRMRKFNTNNSSQFNKNRFFFNIMTFLGFYRCSKLLLNE